MTGERDSGDPARRPGLRALGVAVSQLAAPILGRRGGGLLVRMKADWLAIVGAEWANLCWPAALGRDGALKLRVAPTAALDLQHSAPILLARINLYFGRAAASRVLLVQGPLPLPPPLVAAPPPPVPALPPELNESIAAVADPALRAALGRLGRAVLGAAAAGPVAPERGKR